MSIELNRRALLGGLAALPLAARAQVPQSQVPVLDELTLTVLDDKETFGPFLPDETRPGLAIHYAGNGGAASDGKMRKRALAGEFGLSILASSRLGSERRRVLVDFGYSPEVLASNMALLGIDPASLDASVLSHGHLVIMAGSRRWRGRRRSGAARCRCTSAARRPSAIASR